MNLIYALKGVNKKTQSAKHKKSDASLAKRALKEEKKNAMTIEPTEPVVILTDEQKAVAKAIRKKANAHKSLYKKQILNRTAKLGPRAVNRGG
jgi:hypothetical protein